MRDFLKKEKKVRNVIFGSSMAVLLLSLVGVVALFVAKGNASVGQTAQSALNTVGMTYPVAIHNGIAFFSAALAVGVSVLAAGVAIAGVGSAAVAAVAEKPELLGRTLIFVGLAEGLAIYGLIIAILIFGKLA